MHRHTSRAPGRPLAAGVAAAFVVVASLVSACADSTPAGPSAAPASMDAMAAAPSAAPQDTGMSDVVMSEKRRAPDLGSCDSLRVPAGNRLTFHTYARGVQIYRWDGNAWVFVAPSAALYLDRHERFAAGTHYAGPTWEERKGKSKVMGAVAKRCTPNASAIPWLLLTATASEGRGTFKDVTFIQRVNTAAGLAPTRRGTTVGEEARVGYTTEYFFYKAK